MKGLLIERVPVLPRRECPDRVAMWSAARTGSSGVWTYLQNYSAPETGEWSNYRIDAVYDGGNETRTDSRSGWTARYTAASGLTWSASSSTDTAVAYVNDHTRTTAWSGYLSYDGSYAGEWIRTVHEESTHSAGTREYRDSAGSGWTTQTTLETSGFTGTFSTWSVDGTGYHAYSFSFAGSGGFMDDAPPAPGLNTSVTYSVAPPPGGFPAPMAGYGYVKAVGKNSTLLTANAADLAAPPISPPDLLFVLPATTTLRTPAAPPAAGAPGLSSADLPGTTIVVTESSRVDVPRRDSWFRRCLAGRTGG